MKQQVTWQTSKGLATVTVTLTTSKTVDADGDKVTVPACELHITAEVEGMGMIGCGRPTTVKAAPAGVVACIGSLALSAEHLASINAAIAAAESTPEWQAKLAAEAESRRQSDEYERGREMMRRVMGY